METSAFDKTGVTNHVRDRNLSFDESDGEYKQDGQSDDMLPEVRKR